MSVLIAAAARGQSLAARVAQAPDGVVRMTVPSRPGVCGDGKELVGYRSALFARNFQTFGRWNTDRCDAGPLRVTLDVERGKVVRLRTSVGCTRWPETEGRVTDLGDVPPNEASAYFFSLVPQLEEEYTKDRTLIPAVLADDVPVIQPLLALARNADRAMNTRRSALMWLGILGDASIVPALVEFARDGGSDSDNPKADKKGLAGSALMALSALEDGVGVPALIDLSRTGKTSVRRDAVFWLGQNEDPRGLRAILAIVHNEDESNSVREHAIFSLSQRQDAAATDSLIGLARTEKDTRMRGKVLFWLAQKDDPRVKKLIADLILK